MSDTTPRPDENPTDPTAPPPPPAPEAAASGAPDPAAAPSEPAAPPAAPTPAQPTPPPPQPYPTPAHEQQPYQQQQQQPYQQPQDAQPQYQQQYPQPGYGQPQYAPPPAQPLTPNEERTWAMLSHVAGGAAMVLSAGFLGFVGSLVIYLLYKDRGPFVRAHAANSLNVQITAAIGFLIGWVLAIVLVGFAILAVVFVWAVVMHIIGAIKANNGEWWTPPLTPRFIK